MGFSVQGAAGQRRALSIAPAVVRGSGEAPEQYTWEDDFEDSGLEAQDNPKNYSDEQLQKLYEKLALPDKSIELLHTYFAAMARLYGVIPLRKALEIINAQNDPISESDFLAFAEIVRREDHYYGIFGQKSCSRAVRTPRRLTGKLSNKACMRLI
jgi:hypothetical protein